MQEINVFPISIGIDLIENFENYKDNLLKITKKSNFNLNNNSKKLKHYHNIDINLQLKNILEEKANNYYKNILGYKEDLYISDSWLNVCEKNGFQTDHYHSNCVVSATLYVKLGDKYSSLVFKNPRTNSQPLRNEIKCERGDIDTQYNMDWITFNNIKEGCIVFWPSYLVHGYSDNQFENRTTLSFNLNIKKSNFIYSHPFSEV